MEKIGSHSGSHHADDVLGAAILLALYPEATVVRTREPAVLAECDALIDVGGEHDDARNRFDHHQKSFSLRRENGVPYASSGLVWRVYGERYVSKIVPLATKEHQQQIAAAVDNRLIQHADAVDTGFAFIEPSEFGLSGIIASMNSTWLDEADCDNENFMKAVQLANVVLRQLVIQVSAEFLAADLIRCGTRLSNGKILVLDQPRLPFDPIVVNEMPEVLFVVYPESAGNQHQVRVVPQELGSFTAREDLPKLWAGLRDGDLAKVTGVADAVFCHTGRFICGAKSKAGALLLAELAVRNVMDGK